MDEGVGQLQEKREDREQQEAHAARRADNAAKATEQKKDQLEIQSSSDSRVGNFCSGQDTVKEKHGAKLQPGKQVVKQKI